MTRKLRLKDSEKYPFCLDKVLYAAQDFRWCIWKDDWHSGVLDGNLIHIRQIDDVLEYKSHSGADLDEMLCRYFRLDDPIDDIYDDLASRDPKIAQLVENYPWLRVLRQPDPWECLVAYICAGNSKIEQTTERVNKIAGLGRRVELDGDVRTIFPTWEEILCAGEGELQKMGLRFPQKHSAAIVQAAERIRDCEIELRYLARPNVAYKKARPQLLNLYYVGLKTADCVSLFALGKTEAFPVDIWVERAVKDYLELPANASYNEIVEWAGNLFGDCAGYANQFLFYAEREKDNSSGLKPGDGRDTEGSSRLF